MARYREPEPRPLYSRRLRPDRQQASQVTHGPVNVEMSTQENSARNAELPGQPVRGPVNADCQQWKILFGVWETKTMSATITYKCPNCGGGLQFDPDKQKYACEYCLSEFTQEELERLSPEASADQTGFPSAGMERRRRRTGKWKGLPSFTPVPAVERRS